MKNFDELRKYCIFQKIDESLLNLWPVVGKINFRRTLRVLHVPRYWFVGCNYDRSTRRIPKMNDNRKKQKWGNIFEYIGTILRMFTTVCAIFEGKNSPY